MSSTSRVFNGCRALFAAAKAGTPFAAAKAGTPKSSAAKTTAKPKKRTTTSSSSPAPPKQPRQPARSTGILKPAPVSPALGKFLGVPESSRTDAVKKVWEYIKVHNLQNPANKKEIYCDDMLKTIFEGKDKVGFLEIGRLLSAHFVKTG